MDLKQIKELMAAMKRGGIKKLTIKEKTGYELHLEAEDPHPPYPHTHGSFAYPQVFAAPPHVKEIETPRHAAAIAQHKASPQTELPAAEERGRFVTAPLVGTYYNAPSPEDPPFIKVGDRVDENTVLCIIEAMKVMNEVKAGISGVVEEILIDNTHPVEFGTKMFRIV
jgi:acetyl-CoA carboxylase biotin carboxyl carrier protein